MITLLGRSNSCNVQKVLWALDEMGLAFDHIELGGAFGGNQTDAFLALNPNGSVPVLRDDTLTLCESQAILRYLAARYMPETLWPATAAARAPVDQWMDWVATTFQPAWIGLFWLVVRTPGPQQDAAAIAASLAATDRCLSIMEGQLARVPYLAGDAFSLADIAAGVALYRWSTMPIARPDLPHVAAWHDRLSARKAFRMAVVRRYDELVGRLDY